ncbi:hypothetical protein V5T82_14345 [Magnetovibrio sp. PR-2]
MSETTKTTASYPQDNAHEVSQPRQDNTDPDLQSQHDDWSEMLANADNFY